MRAKGQSLDYRDSKPQKNLGVLLKGSEARVWVPRTEDTDRCSARRALDLCLKHLKQ